MKKKAKVVAIGRTETIGARTSVNPSAARTKVSALVFGIWAVHPAVHHPEEGFVVTHIPTGKCLQRAGMPAAACVLIARELHEDGTVNVKTETAVRSRAKRIREIWARNGGTAL